MRSSVPSPRRTSSPSKTYAVVDGKPKLGGRVRHIHRRAAVHVAAGLRMRRALATAPLDDRSEAIFEADGRLAHAAGQAAYGDVRARLREAVQRIDRARTDAVRREEVEALELWQGLVEGRWSLIDRYDTDGRRYYVAMANPPDGVDARQLTGVEAQVTAQVVAGEPNGIIAYSLGVSESTVAGHLSNARLSWLRARFASARDDAALTRWRFPSPMSGQPDPLARRSPSADVQRAESRSASRSAVISRPPSFS